MKLGARYALRPWRQLLAQVNNLFDRRYHTGAQLGPVAFSSTGAFVAQAPDGALHITDSQKGKIWRVKYTGAR